MYDGRLSKMYDGRLWWKIQVWKKTQVNLCLSKKLCKTNKQKWPTTHLHKHTKEEIVSSSSRLRREDQPIYPVFPRNLPSYLVHSTPIKFTTYPTTKSTTRTITCCHDTAGLTLSRRSCEKGYYRDPVMEKCQILSRLLFVFTGVLCAKGCRVG